MAFGGVQWCDLTAESRGMDFSANSSSLPAASGGARGFVAARRRRRQELEAAPELRWERATTRPSDEADLVPAGTPVWALRLKNAGGEATEARVVLFSADAIVRGIVGDAGRIARGDTWDLILGLPAEPASPFRGYVLAQGADKRWHAATVDGRTASFRTLPDELGVRRTLGLKMPAAAAEHDGLVRSEQSAAADVTRSPAS